MTTYDTSDLSEPGYYIVNPKGAIHECTKKHATARFQQVGWRMATDAEVATYHQVASGSGQSWDSPIAAPFSTDPSAILKAQAEQAVEEASPNELRFHPGARTTASNTERHRTGRG